MARAKRDNSSLKALVVGDANSAWSEFLEPTIRKSRTAQGETNTENSSVVRIRKPLREPTEGELRRHRNNPSALQANILSQDHAPFLNLVNATAEPARARMHVGKDEKSADVLIYVVNLSSEQNNIEELKANITTYLQQMRPDTRLILVGTHPSSGLFDFPQTSDNEEVLNSLRGTFASRLINVLNLPPNSINPFGANPKDKEIENFITQLDFYASNRPAPQVQLSQPSTPTHTAPAAENVRTPRQNLNIELEFPSQPQQPPAQPQPSPAPQNVSVLTRHDYPKSYHAMWTRQTLPHLSTEKRNYLAARTILEDYALRTSDTASRWQRAGHFFAHPRRGHTEIINNFLKNYTGEENVPALLSALQQTLKKEIKEEFNPKGSLAVRMDYIEEQCNLNADNRIINHEEIIKAREDRINPKTDQNQSLC